MGPDVSLKCTKIDFFWALSESPMGECCAPQTALPRPASWISGTLLLREGRKGKRLRPRKSLTPPLDECHYQIMT